MDNIHNYLGIGAKYPLQLLDGKASLSTGLESVEQSISRILGTPVGSVIGNRDYGSRLHELSFEPNIEVLRSLLKHFAQESINLWEKRVRFLDLTIVIDESLVKCTISYRILGSTDIQNFIYPYYRQLSY